MPGEPAMPAGPGTPGIPSSFKANICPGAVQDPKGVFTRIIWPLVPWEPLSPLGPTGPLIPDTRQHLGQPLRLLSGKKGCLEPRGGH